MRFDCHVPPGGNHTPSPYEDDVVDGAMMRPTLGDSIGPVVAESA